MNEFLSSKEVQKAAAITAIGVFAAGTVVGIKKADTIVEYFAPSPEKILADANKQYAESGATPDECYPAVMEAGGVLGDLIAEIQKNKELDINRIHGYTDAAGQISDILSALHTTNDSDHHDTVQIGDRYEYCVLEDGTVIPGDHRNYVIVDR